MVAIMWLASVGLVGSSVCAELQRKVKRFSSCREFAALTTFISGRSREPCTTLDTGGDVVHVVIGSVGGLGILGNGL